jgi:hypothetical protein
MLVVIDGLVLFAGLCTWIAPLYELRLMRRADGRVDAVAVQKVLFVIPWSTQSAVGVTGVGARVDQSPPTTNVGARADEDDTSSPDAIGTLYLKTSGGVTSVLVAPGELTEARRVVDDFLGGDASEASTTLVSHWPGAVVVPAILLALAAFFLLGTISGAASRSATRSASGPPSSADL